MVLFPLLAALVSAVFAASLFRRFARARRVPQLAWGIALAQFAIASVAVAAGVANRWDVPTYKIFWLFGALLNVPWLAAGSIALATKRLVGYAAVAAVAVLSVYATGAVAGASADGVALAAVDGIPRGKEIWGEGSSMTSLARLYSIVAWLVVVGVALWSSKPRRGLRLPPERVKGNVLIAVGVSIVAIGGFALSRVGRGSAFSITLALGVLVMYAGFLLASRAGRHRVEDPGDSPT